MKRHPSLDLVGLPGSVFVDPPSDEHRALIAITRRRLLFAGAALPLITVVAARAQPLQKPVLIGWLDAGSRETSEHRLAAFKEEFAVSGWKEGPDYRLEERWAQGRLERLPQLAAEIAAKGPTLIVAAPSASVAAAAKSAPKTPIVQANGDPLSTGLVKSLARPGGMITGMSNANAEVTGKFLELLLTAAPKVQRVGFLSDPANPFGTEVARRSAERSRIQSIFAEAARPEDIEPALARLAKDRIEALILLNSGWFVVERRRFVKLALDYRWPLVAPQREFSEAGALLSYGVDRTALYRRAATYVDKILKGAKPADLPIEQGTKIEIVINARTARTLGLTLPSELLLRANHILD